MPRSKVKHKKLVPGPPPWTVPEIRVAFVGSRSIDVGNLPTPVVAILAGIQEFLWKLVVDGNQVVLVSGEGKGADEINGAMYKELSRRNQQLSASSSTFHENRYDPKIMRFYPDWQKFKKGAGPIRNQRMLDEGQPWLIYALVDKPLAASKGTRDIITRAKLHECRPQIAIIDIQGFDLDIGLGTHTPTPVVKDVVVKRRKKKPYAVKSGSPVAGA